MGNKKAPKRFELAETLFPFTLDTHMHNPHIGHTCSVPRVLLKQNNRKSLRLLHASVTFYGWLVYHRGPGRVCLCIYVGRCSGLFFGSIHTECRSSKKQDCIYEDHFRCCSDFSYNTVSACHEHLQRPVIWGLVLPISVYVNQLGYGAHKAWNGGKILASSKS